MEDQSVEITVYPLTFYEALGKAVKGATVMNSTSDVYEYLVLKSGLSIRVYRPRGLAVMAATGWLTTQAEYEAGWRVVDGGE
jgi:hypothetical protein